MTPRFISPVVESTEAYRNVIAFESHGSVREYLIGQAHTDEIECFRAII